MLTSGMAAQGDKIAQGGVNMYYFNIEKWIMITLAIAVLIADLTFAAYIIYPYARGKHIMSYGVIPITMVLLLMNIPSYILYLLQIRMNTMSYKDIERENIRRKQLKRFLYMLCMVYFMLMMAGRW